MVFKDKYSYIYRNSQTKDVLLFRFVKDSLTEQADTVYKIL